MTDEAEQFNEQLDRLFANQLEVDEGDPLLRLSRSLREALTPVAPAPRFRAALKAELLERYANNIRPFPVPVRPARPSPLRWARRAALGALVAAAASMGVIYGYGSLHQQATPRPSVVSQHLTPTPGITPPVRATTRRHATAQPGAGAPNGQPGNGDAPPAALGGHTRHGGHAGRHHTAPSRGSGGPAVLPTNTPRRAPTQSSAVAQELTATPTAPPPPTATTPPTATLPPATATAPAPTATQPPAPTTTPATRPTSGAVIVPRHMPVASPTARPANTQPRPTSTPIPPTATAVPPTATARPTRAAPSATPAPPTPRPTTQRHVTLAATATPIAPTPTPIPAVPTATETPVPPATATSIAAPSDTPVAALPSATPTTAPQVTAVAQVSVTPRGIPAGQNPGSPTPPTAALQTFPAPSAANAGPASPLVNTQVYTPAVSLQLPAALSAAPGSSIAVFAPAPQQESALTILRTLNLTPEAVLPQTRSETDARVRIDSRLYLARLMPDGTGYHLNLALATPDQAPASGFDAAAATAAAHRFLAAHGLDGQLGDAVAMQNGSAMTVTLTQRYVQQSSYPLLGAQTVLTFDAAGVLTGADIRWINTAAAVEADALSPAQALAAVEAGRGWIAVSGGVVPDPASVISGETILYVPVLGAGGAAYYEPVYQFTGATSSNVPFQIYVPAVSPALLR